MPPVRRGSVSRGMSTLSRDILVGEDCGSQSEEAGYSKPWRWSFGDRERTASGVAPYDSIRRRCRSQHSRPFSGSIVDGGKMLVPVGGRLYQDFIRVVRRGRDVRKENPRRMRFRSMIVRTGYR